VGDITYVWTAQGWNYLAVLFDLFARRVVGWAFANHMRQELPLKALRRALEARQPGPGLIHHGDRGSQGGFNRSSQHLDDEVREWKRRGGGNPNKQVEPKCARRVDHP